MRLFIAEKPAMGREIAKWLAGPHKNKDGYIETGEGWVTWCIGHLMEMPTPDQYKKEWEKWDWQSLPIIPDWQIKVTNDKRKQFNVIKDLVGQASEIINAGDPGREGQLIIDEILFYLKNKKPVKRILLYGLDKKSVRDALNKLENNQKFFPLYQSGVARGRADWLVGINSTRAYTLLSQKNGYRGVLSVGRVQSPTLAIVVNRDELIENFVPQNYFLVIGEFNKGKTFNAWWKAQDNTPNEWLDEESRIKNKEVAENIANKVKNKNGVISKYEERIGEEGPPLPFNLSKLQSYANSKWGFSAKEVLDLCQSLYEKGLQSYPRSDCQYLPENLFPASKEILDELSNIDQLKNSASGADHQLKSAAWDDKKIGEHYGIIPTGEKIDNKNLSAKEMKIYLAVCERYIAQFYPNCKFKAAVLEIEVEKELFKATGRVILIPGWRSVFMEEKDDDEEEVDEKEQVFPDLKQGDKILCSNAKVEAKKTKPPGRFTDGTLIKAMTNVHTLVKDPEKRKKLKEIKGIGREATRTQIIEALVSRKLLNRQGKQLISSPAARILVKNLPASITDPALTAIWENGLEKIAANQLDFNLFMEKQIAWVTKIISDAKSGQIEIKVENNNINNTENKNKTEKDKAKQQQKYQNLAKKSQVNEGDSCPACKKGKMVKKVGKNTGKEFLGCSTWPKCQFVSWINKK